MRSFSDRNRKCFRESQYGFPQHSTSRAIKGMLMSTPIQLRWGDNVADAVRRNVARFKSHP
ncbi:MAG: hypothetical protein MUF23_03730 [Pirellula sp.]|nr:hypothetical protein [Pirellula sp.]